MNSVAEYVRICPVCDTQAAAEQANCQQCGALLFGVDLTRKSDYEAAVADASKAARAAATTPDAEQAICAYADCGASNPATSQDCLYCGRPLQTSGKPARPDGGRQTASDADVVLPTKLAARFTLLTLLQGSRAEASKMILSGRKTGVKVAAKLYQPGLQPNVEVLARLRKAALAHVARVIDYDATPGEAFELVEYCANGSLRDMINSRQPAERLLRSILEEIASALAELHAMAIVHCNLKPENVLVRSIEPLDLVLTDFGVVAADSSGRANTVRTKTLKYAAPESLSGVVDGAVDYWSLGMMLLEILTGQHPFDGLSNAVITHYLITGSIDVSSVRQAEWQKLCSGLLLRDPAKRWGAAQIERWLAGDVTLAQPGSNEYVPARPAAQPYRIAEESCRTPLELAAALASNWAIACKDLIRGTLTAWAAQDLKDHNLARYLQDLLDARDISDDMRLMRLVRHLAPGLPPVWRGESLEVKNILALAAKAQAGDREAADWLGSVYFDKVLRELKPEESPVVTALAARWETAYERCLGYWRQQKSMREKHVQAVSSIDGVVDYDSMVYGDHTRLNDPSPGQLLPALMLSLVDADFARQLKQSTRQQAAAWLPNNSWLEQLLDSEDVAAWVIAGLLLPIAEQVDKDVRLKLQREEVAEADRYQQFVAQANEALTALRQVGEISVFANRASREIHLEHCLRVLDLFDEVSAAGIYSNTPLGSTLLRAQPLALAIQQSLDRWSHGLYGPDLFQLKPWRDMLGGWGRVLTLMQTSLIALIAANVLIGMLLSAFDLLTSTALFILLCLILGLLAWQFWRMGKIRDELRGYALQLPSRVPKRNP